MKPLVKFAKPSTNIHGTKTLLKLPRNKGRKNYRCEETIHMS